jgi:HJR/Mrr/RecB family endonuclease
MNDWAKLSPDRFEKLCSDLLEQNGFFNIRRIGGSGDRGRDILANKQITLIKGVNEVQQWLIQCKRYAKTNITIDDICHELTQARAHKPDYYALIICNTLMPNVHDWLESVKNQYAFKINILDVDWLDRQLNNQPYLVKEYFENYDRKRTYDIVENTDLQIYTAGKMPSEATRGALTWWREEFQREVLKLGHKIGFYHPEFTGCDHTGIYLSETVLNDFQMIAKSNLVMVYLEENEQYGTITEIMIAYSLNKQIAVFIDESIKIEIHHGEDYSDIAEEYEKIFETNHLCPCTIMQELEPIHYNKYWFLIEFLRQKDNTIYITMTNKKSAIKDMTAYVKQFTK